MSRSTRIALVLGGVVLLALIAVGTWAVDHVGIQLTIDDELAVSVTPKVPFRLHMTQPLSVTMNDAIHARVQLAQLEIPLDETIKVPLKLDVQVPIDTEIAVRDTIEISMNVPIDMVLTERELDLSSLEVPLDTEIFIDDKIDVDFAVPIDTEVTTLLGVKVPVKLTVPIKAKVPVRQKVRVRDTLKVPVRKLRVPFRATIPVSAKVPINQTFHVKGLVHAPIQQTLEIPLKQTIRPKLDQELAAVVHLDGRVPARLEGELVGAVALDEPLPAKISPLKLDLSNVRVELR